MTASKQKNEFAQTCKRLIVETKFIIFKIWNSVKSRRVQIYELSSRLTIWVDLLRHQTKHCLRIFISLLLTRGARVLAIVCEFVGPTKVTYCVTANIATHTVKRRLMLIKMALNEIWIIICRPRCFEFMKKMSLSLRKTATLIMCRRLTLNIQTMNFL